MVVAKTFPLALRPDHRLLLQTLALRCRTNRVGRCNTAAKLARRPPNNTCLPPCRTALCRPATPWELQTDQELLSVAPHNPSMAVVFNRSPLEEATYPQPLKGPMAKEVCRRASSPSST